MKLPPVAHPYQALFLVSAFCSTDQWRVKKTGHLPPRRHEAGITRASTMAFAYFEGLSLFVARRFSTG
jgi:hypothetical protein